MTTRTRSYTSPSISMKQNFRQTQPSGIGTTSKEVATASPSVLVSIGRSIAPPSVTEASHSAIWGAEPTINIGKILTVGRANLDSSRGLNHTPSRRQFLPRENAAAGQLAKARFAAALALSFSRGGVA